MKDYLVIALFHACLLTVGAALPGPLRADNPLVRPFSDIAKEISERLLQKQAEDARTEEQRDVSLAEQMMTAYKRMGPKTKQLEALERDQMKTDLKLESVLLALSENNPDLVARQLSDDDLDLFTRQGQRAVRDPNCNREITCDENAIFRTIDGTCNNLENPLWGSAGLQHWRILPFSYDFGNDGQSKDWALKTLSVLHRNRRDPKLLPNVRTVSNMLNKYPGEETTETPSREDLSQMVWAWGQFIAHDMVRSPEGDVRGRDCCSQRQITLDLYPTASSIVYKSSSLTSEGSDVSPKKRKKCHSGYNVPDDDPVFPRGTCMPAKRSKTVFTCNNRFQNQLNEQTAYIDGSHIYGTSREEMLDLRTGTAGLLKESTRRFPPNDTSPNEACIRKPTGYYCAKSEQRANVAPSLTMLHTLFVREHNRIATDLGRINPHWDDEKLFQEARKIVAAELQLITYGEFLPVYVSAEAMENYGLTTPTPTTGYSYDREINASIMSAFAIGFRGHSLIPNKFKFFDENYNAGEPLSTTDTYFSPYLLFENHYKGIDDTARWVVKEKCPMADSFVDHVARNELFKSIDDSGRVTAFDLAALNAKRGRDWGIPGYGKYLEFCTGSTVNGWEDLIHHSDDVLGILQKLYHSPYDVDLYAGLVTERIDDGSMTGPTAQCLLGKQFELLKKGDRFWHETTETVENSEGEQVNIGFTEDQLSQIRRVRLSKIICDNLEGIIEIPENVFTRTTGSSDLLNCANLRQMDLDKWFERE